MSTDDALSSVGTTTLAMGAATSPVDLSGIPENPDRSRPPYPDNAPNSIVAGAIVNTVLSTIDTTLTAASVTTTGDAGVGGVASSGGLSAGAIAAVVVGCVAVLAFAAAVAAATTRSRRLRRRAKRGGGNGDRGGTDDADRFDSRSAPTLPFIPASDLTHARRLLLHAHYQLQQQQAVFDHGGSNGGNSIDDGDGDADAPPPSPTRSSDDVASIFDPRAAAAAKHAQAAARPAFNPFSSPSVRTVSADSPFASPRSTVVATRSVVPPPPPVPAAAFVEYLPRLTSIAPVLVSSSTSSASSTSSIMDCYSNPSGAAAAAVPLLGVRSTNPDDPCAPTMRSSPIASPTAAGSNPGPAYQTF
ncbi:hypothetical protein HDU83_009206 [Entophlyctis luteolus]|nr:hypothetical protein HDU83_009206 [Entophlyctis luteolus]